MKDIKIKYCLKFDATLKHEGAYFNWLEFDTIKDLENYKNYLMAKDASLLDSDFLIYLKTETILLMK